MPELISATEPSIELRIGGGRPRFGVEFDRSSIEMRVKDVENNKD
jgi:hypothetical protein